MNQSTNLRIANNSSTTTNSAMKQVLKVLLEQSRKMDAQTHEFKNINQKIDKHSTCLDLHNSECIKVRGAFQN